MNRHLGPKVASAQPSHAARELEWVLSECAADEVVARMAAQRRARRRRQVAAFGSVAVLAAGLFVALPRRGADAAQQLARAPETSAVRVLEPSRERLADGSVVESATPAAIAVDLSGRQRRVELRSGRAHFAVAKDPTRPFVVSAAGIEVRAVGTGFAVSHVEGGVEVIVTEGTVAVGRPETVPILAVAGQRVRVPAGAREDAVLGVAEDIARDEQARSLGWRIPQLRFSAAPLGDVITAFNRFAEAHGGPRLEADLAITTLKVSGALRADDFESLLVLLRNDFDVAAGPVTDGRVRLRPSR